MPATIMKGERIRFFSPCPKVSAATWRSFSPGAAQPPSNIVTTSDAPTYRTMFIFILPPPVLMGNNPHKEHRVVALWSAESKRNRIDAIRGYSVLRMRAVAPETGYGKVTYDL